MKISIAVAAAITAAALTPAHATDETASITCGTATTSCYLMAHLQAAAQAYARTHTGSTILLTVVSVNAPVAAQFKLTWACGLNCHEVVTALSTGDADNIELDGRMFGRATKLAPITVNVPASSTEEQVSAAVESVLVYQNISGYAAWHLYNFQPPIIQAWWQFKDLQTGQLVDIYYYDIITIIYPDGSQEKLRIVQAVATTTTHPWHRVTGTRIPAPPPNTTPAKPITGVLRNQNYWSLGNSTIIIEPSSSQCWGTASTTVTAPNGDTLTGSSNFSGGC